MSCAFASHTPVSFGAYDVLAKTPLDSAGTVTLLCTQVRPGDTVTLELSPGAGGSYTPRRLSGRGDTALRYNLYLDASRTRIWGNGTGSTGRYGPVAPRSGVPLVLTIYGRVPPHQPVRSGTFSDAIVLTVNF